MDFEDFWKTFPRKIAKLAARTAWDRAIKIATPEEIIAGAKRYGEWLQETGEWRPYPAHPTTWLNQGRWMDELNSKPAFDAKAYAEKIAADRQARLEAQAAKERLWNHPHRLLAARFIGE